MVPCQDGNNIIQQRTRKSSLGHTFGQSISSNRIPWRMRLIKASLSSFYCLETLSEEIPPTVKFDLLTSLDRPVSVIHHHQCRLVVFFLCGPTLPEIRSHPLNSAHYNVSPDRSIDSRIEFNDREHDEFRLFSLWWLGRYEAIRFCVLLLHGSAWLQ